MQQTADVIIKNSSQIVTFKGPERGRIREEMADNAPIKNGAIAIKEGKIIWIGPNDKLTENIAKSLPNLMNRVL